MLYGATTFDQPIGSWDVSRVTTMQAMFDSTIFNQDIGSWDVSNVEDFSYMFYLASFNQDVWHEYFIDGLDKSSIQAMYTFVDQTLIHIEKQRPVDGAAFLDIDGRSIVYDVIVFRVENFVLVYKAWLF